MFFLTVLSLSAIDRVNGLNEGAYTIKSLQPLEKAETQLITLKQLQLVSQGLNEYRMEVVAVLEAYLAEKLFAQKIEEVKTSLRSLEEELKKYNGGPNSDGSTTNRVADEIKTWKEKSCSLTKDEKWQTYGVQQKCS